MGVVFLLVRLMFGGYLAWHGARYLSPGTRQDLIADARRDGVPLPLAAVPVAGLMLTVGGISIATGLFPATGVALLLAILVPSAFTERRRLWRNVMLAVITVAFLAVPQPWPLTMGR